MTADVTVAVGVVGVVVVVVVGVVEAAVVVVDVAGVVDAVVVGDVVGVVDVAAAVVDVAGVVDAAAVVDVAGVVDAAAVVVVDAAVVVQLATTAAALVFRAVSHSELMPVDEQAERTPSSLANPDLMLSSSVVSVLLNCASTLAASAETTGQLVAFFAPACLTSTKVRAFTPASL